MDLYEIKHLSVDCPCPLGSESDESACNYFSSYLIDLTLSMHSAPLDLSLVIQQVSFLLSSFPFQSLGDAAFAIARIFLFPSENFDFQLPTDVSLTINALKPSSSDVHVFTSSFTRESVLLNGPERGPHERNPWGNVDVLFEAGPAAGLYRLHIAPGAAIPLHVHHVMHEGELVVVAPPVPPSAAATAAATAASGLLNRRGVALPPGAVHRWGHAPHAYRNTAPDRWATLLCVDVPAFLPADEIRVDSDDQEAAGFQPESRPVSPLLLPPLLPPLDPTVLLNLGMAGGNQPHMSFPGGAHQHIDLLTCASAAPATPLPQPHAAMVFAFDARGRLLLVRHRRRGWELPGGGLDADDGGDAAHAVCRELFEESGLLPKGAEHVRVAEARAAWVAQLCVVGQYVIRSDNKEETEEKEEKLAGDGSGCSEETHVKRVFACLLTALPAALDEALWDDTVDRVWLAPGPPSWTHVSAAIEAALSARGQQGQQGQQPPVVVSPLLLDNVWSIERLAAYDAMRPYFSCEP